MKTADDMHKNVRQKQQNIQLIQKQLEKHGQLKEGASFCSKEYRNYTLKRNYITITISGMVPCLIWLVWFLSLILYTIYIQGTPNLTYENIL